MTNNTSQHTPLQDTFIDLRALYQSHHPHTTQETKAQEMARYMKNQFPFIGICAPERETIIKPVIKASKNWSTACVIKHILHYYQQPEREYHYLSVALILANIKRLTWENWENNLLGLIDHHSWWDSVDALRKPLGLWLLKQPQHLPHLIQTYQNAPSIWKRRIAITVQLQYKNATHTELLANAILANKNEDEFFIQKGIGWALREYSKTNPQWVKKFFSQHTLSKLAMREGSKYI